ncbi:MAG: peptidyl-prolyl cis-trans isomerase [Lachnospiraceae bacterium]
MKYKKMLIMMATAICLGLMPGCEKNEEEVVNVVYEYGDASITYGEFYIYAKTIQEDYQKTYGEGIWSLELETENGKKSMRDVTVADIISDINCVKVMVAQAEDLDISLKDDEKETIAKQADDFYSGLTKKDIQQTEITKDDVIKVMEENMIASKVYEQIISECDYEISDEEARMTTFYDVVFECYDVKKDGSVEEYTEEQKALQYEKAQEALETLAKEEDATYEEIVDKYNLKYSNSYTMKKTDIVEEYGGTVADKILALSDGEISPVIESQYGYHIFKMIEANDKELTKKNKEEIVAQMQREFFDETYEKWAKKYDSHFDMELDVNYDMIKGFPFKEQQED